MKKVLVFCFTLMLFLVCAKAKTKKKYLALGDSITEGYTIEDKSKIYASIFAKKNDLELTNEAVSGDKSGVLLEKLNNYNIDDYDVITLCIGANNILRPFLDKVASTPSEDMLEMLVTIKNDEEFNKEVEEGIKALDEDLTKIMEIIKGGHAQIYFFNIYNPYNRNIIQPLEETSDFYVKKMNEVIEKHKDGTHFIDMYKKFEKKKGDLINSQKLQKENFMDPHPTEDGHKFIASVIDEEYDRNNPKTLNMIITIITAILIITIEIIEIIYTTKTFTKKSDKNVDMTPKLEIEEEKKNDSSRFIRS